MKITCIADLHGHYPKLDGGDLLIVAGDLTVNDSRSEYDKFFDWFACQEYTKKLYIAGNHDNLIGNGSYSTPAHCDAHYLCDSGTEFEGLKIWGSPWSLWFDGINPNCKAFTGSEKDLEKKFRLIPDDIGILITHCPPFGIMDKTIDGIRAGSTSLLEELKRVRPKIHVFGHIHERYGEDEDEWWGRKIKRQRQEWPRTKYINASHVNEHYKPINNPINIEL